MRRLIVSIHVLLMIAYGFSPAMAVPGVVPDGSASPSVSLTFPDGAPLTDTALQKVNGDFYWELVPVVIGSYAGAKSAHDECSNCGPLEKTAVTVVGGLGGMAIGAYAGAADLLVEAGSVATKALTFIAGEGVVHKVAEEFGHFIGHSTSEASNYHKPPRQSKIRRGAGGGGGGGW